MFTKVSARIVGGKVIVTVVESSQVINRVAFEGNNKLKSDQLDVEVQSKGHTAFDAAKADADIDRIKDAYKKIGRSDIEGDLSAGATCRTAASISSSRSTRATRPACARSSSSATRRSRTIACIA